MNHIALLIHGGKREKGEGGGGGGGEGADFSHTEMKATTLRAR